MATRVAPDALGAIEVPVDRYWGGQTQRSRASALSRRRAHWVNRELGLLPEEKARAIAQAAQEVVEGKLDAHFFLVGLADWERPQAFFRTAP